MEACLLPLKAFLELQNVGVWHVGVAYTAPSCSNTLEMYNFSSPLYWDIVNTQLLRRPSLATSGWNSSKEALSSSLPASIQQSYKE